MTELFSLRDACDALKVQPHVVAYLFATKKLPEPQRIGGRRMFSVEDLTRISEFLKLSVDLGKGDRGA